jgi:hypothetical protein
MATNEQESTQQKPRPSSFSERFGRNTVLVGIPWFLIGLILSWPKSLPEAALAGLSQLPGTLVATLFFTALEHWYVRAKSRKG